MCAFDYQLYSDTRRIREKMSLVYLLTIGKTLTDVCTVCVCLPPFLFSSSLFVSGLLLYIILWERKENSRMNLVRQSVRIKWFLRAGVEAEFRELKHWTLLRRSLIVFASHLSISLSLFPSLFHPHSLAHSLCLSCARIFFHTASVQYILANKRFSRCDSVCVLIRMQSLSHSRPSHSDSLWIGVSVHWICVLLCLCVSTIHVQFCFIFVYSRLFSFHFQYWKILEQFRHLLGNI